MKIEFPVIHRVPRVLADALSIIFTFLPSGHAQAQPLTAVSYGGSYARAYDRGYHERFEAETGIKTIFADFTGGLAQTRAQVEIGNVFWDVEVRLTPCPSQ